MRSLKRRLKRIENWKAERHPLDSVIISGQPSAPCKLYDMDQCPDYLKALQESPDRIVIYTPGCSHCTESGREGA